MFSRSTLLSCVCACALLAACGDDEGGKLTGGQGGQAAGTSSGGNDGEGGISLGQGGSTGQGGSEICESVAQVADDIQLDMLVVLDRSGSMSGTNWDGSVNALTQFFSDSASNGVGVAMSFFPLNGVTDTCNPNHYNPPHVDLGVLGPPENYATTLVSALNTENPSGPNTPIYGALFGSYQWATELQDDNPEHKVIVVFASDGEPNSCPSSPENQNDTNVIASIAASAYNYNGVQTYAIAITGADLVTLNAIAFQGGTGQAFDVTADVSQFKAKMEEIQQKALGCEFLVPAQVEGGAEFDATKLNVNYTPGDGGAEQELPQASDASDCGAGPGWYYDDLVNPTKVTLCPATCNAVTADPDPTVALLFGCPTKMN